MLLFESVSAIRHLRSTTSEKPMISLFPFFPMPIFKFTNSWERFGPRISSVCATMQTEPTRFFIQSWVVRRMPEKCWKNCSKIPVSNRSGVRPAAPGRQCCPVMEKEKNR